MTGGRISRRRVLSSSLLGAATLAASATFAKTGIPWTAGTSPYPRGFGATRFFTQPERRCVDALVARLIPTDDLGPGAREAGVVDFIDEWISAPYPDNQRDKPIVVDGLAWLDEESQRRFKSNFSALMEKARVAICDDISAAKPAAQFEQAAKFFSRYRALTAGGYYTTPVGMKDLRYVGNVAMTKFDGPPPEVLKKLGLA